VRCDVIVIEMSWEGDMDLWFCGVGLGD
jgi:hypothetical protein